MRLPLRGPLASARLRLAPRRGLRAPRSAAIPQRGALALLARSAASAGVPRLRDTLGSGRAAFARLCAMLPRPRLRATPRYAPAFGGSGGCARLRPRRGALAPSALPLGRPRPCRAPASPLLRFAGSRRGVGLVCRGFGYASPSLVPPGGGWAACGRRPPRRLFRSPPPACSFNCVTRCTLDVVPSLCLTTRCCPREWNIRSTPCGRVTPQKAAYVAFHEKIQERRNHP